MNVMLTISNDALPQTCLSYIAFRVALLDTLERIALNSQFDSDPHGRFGFLTEVPFLRNVPPHVQVDLLGESWSRHVSDQPIPATLVDESVIYACCETTARLVDEDPSAVKRFLSGGPLDVQIDADHQLASELRALHLNLASEGDFLLISQFEDMDPDEGSRLKRKFGLDESRLEAMFDALGRWRVSRRCILNMRQLLTDAELSRIAFELNLKTQDGQITL
jgi:hypothetical protein